MSQTEEIITSRNFSLRRMLWWVALFCFVAAVLGGLWRTAEHARRRAIGVASQGPLNQVVLALHNYHDTYGCLPPAYIADASGRPMHSWRILIAPYLEASDVYRQYDFNEPWDGPNNRKLFDRMPRAFCSPSEPESTRFTNVVVFDAEGAAFDGMKCSTFEQFEDGKENIVLLGEISKSDVVWLEPRDIRLRGRGRSTKQATGDLRLSSVPWRRPYITFADTIHAYSVAPSLTEDELYGLATIQGGEPIIRDDLIGAGKLD